MTERFLEYLAAEKRYSPNTILSYKKDLTDFVGFVQQTEGHDNPLRADRKVVRNFIAQLSQDGLARRTINRKLSALRSFYFFMLGLGELKESPVDGIASLKFYAEKQIPFSHEEMEQLQQQDPFTGKNAALKELIIEVLYQTGMRRMELCNLTLNDVDLEAQEMRVHGKGNRMRIIPISAWLASRMAAYLKQRPGRDGAEQAFFINSSGKKLNPKFVYSAVNNYLSTVTTKMKKSPHILRHTFATHVLDNGAEISRVKKIMGHQSLASTQVYTHANIEQLKKVFNNAHPRAKKSEL